MALFWRMGAAGVSDAPLAPAAAVGWVASAVIAEVYDASPSGAAGGAFGNNPQVLQALQACGITIPSAAPSAAPSS